MRANVWRKGRWWWHCNTQNNTMVWKDHSACSARSRGTWTTKHEAELAGRRHELAHGHKTGVTQIQKYRQLKRKRND